MIQSNSRGGSLPIFEGNFIDFKGTVTRLCNLEHFYMLMNNSGLGFNESESTHRNSDNVSGTESQLHYTPN